MLEHNLDSSLNKVIQVNPGGVMETKFLFKPKGMVYSEIDFAEQIYYEEIVMILKQLKIILKNNSSKKVTKLSWKDEILLINELEVGDYTLDIESEEFEIEFDNLERKKIEIKGGEEKSLVFKILKNSKDKYLLKIK